MASLKDIVTFCDQRVATKEIRDFSGAVNGLQISNNGSVTKIAAAVDAGLIPFQKAVAQGVDFLIVHHGLFWEPLQPLIGAKYNKIKVMMGGNCALYGSHLPLDCHPEIGNNAILADKLGLGKVGTFLPYEGNDIGLLTQGNLERSELRDRLTSLFPKGFTSIEYGSSHPERIAILTGSGSSAVEQLRDQGVDTLITGELKQNFYNYAQEAGLNLYLCGHYATEVFGVQALSQEVGKQFDLPVEFISTDCPL